MLGAEEGALKDIIDEDDQIEQMLEDGEMEIQNEADPEEQLYDADGEPFIPFAVDQSHTLRRP